MTPVSKRFAASVFMIWLIGLSATAQAEQFRFVALGDTTYEVPADYPLYRALIDSINAASPAFSIHVGDTKGWGDCGDEFQLGQKAYFDSFAQPVMYAPGNNEWSDCWKENRGSHDPVVVLHSMRKIFFGEPYSMGQTQRAVVRQSQGTDYGGGEFGEYVENQRWSTEEVTFATINAVGDHNNQFLRDEHLWREFVDREKANVAWINATFAAAQDAHHKAIVIAMHSDVFGEMGRTEGGSFQPLLQAIQQGAAAFGGQVLVVHGHEHTFIIDRPLRVWDDETTTTTGDNLTRLEVYGWPDMKAVEVSVDTDKPWVFGFEPLYAVPSLSPAFAD